MTPISDLAPRRFHVFRTLWSIGSSSARLEPKADVIAGLIERERRETRASLQQRQEVQAVLPPADEP
jgi:hypothetical protein